MYYSPNNKEYLNLVQLRKKFNSCIPDNTNLFNGYYKVYPGTKPETNKYQTLVILPDVVFVKGKCYETYEVRDMNINVAKNMAKNEAKTKYNTAKANKQAYVKSSLGINIQCNDTALTNINQMLLTNKDEYTFITYENEEYKASKEDIQKILEEVANVQENLYIQYQNYKTTIENAEKTEDIANLNIEYKMEI